MRVAFVTVDTPRTHPCPRTRRIERVAHQVNGTDEHSAVVFCNQWWGGEPDTFEQDGLTYVAVTTDRSPRRFGAKLPLALRNSGADVVHAAYWPLAGALGAGLGGRTVRRPILLDWYGDHTVDSTTRWLDTTTRLCHRLLTPSRHIRTNVRELGVADDRTGVIPDSIDIPLIRSVDPIDGPEILTARRLDADANVEMMLLGLAELRDRDFEAAVIGDGPRREEYQERAEELRIADRVSFPGELSQQEKIAHYKGAHVFVQTARRCPFARQLLWALACGCAGIVDYQEDSAAHELVETLDRGFRTTSSEALSQAIRDATDHEQLTFNDSYTRFDHGTILQEYLDLYRELDGG